MRMVGSEWIKEGDMKTNDWLRWVHFLAGLSVSFYFFAMPSDGWSDGVNTLYRFGVVSFLFWTGVIRWNLPRIRRWRARKRIPASS